MAFLSSFLPIALQCYRTTWRRMPPLKGECNGETDPRSGESDQEDQRRAGDPRRSPSGIPIGAVQRLRKPKLPLQGGSAQEARALLPAEFDPEGKEPNQVRQEAARDRGQEATEELCSPSRPHRSLDRALSRALPAQTGTTRVRIASAQSPERTWYSPVSSSLAIFHRPGRPVSAAPSTRLPFLHGWPPSQVRRKPAVPAGRARIVDAFVTAPRRISPLIRDRRRALASTILTRPDSP